MHVKFASFLDQALSELQNRDTRRATNLALRGSWGSMLKRADTTSSGGASAGSEDTDAHPQAGAPDGLPVPRRYWSVAAIWLAMTMSVLDGAIANVALPTIAHELQASAASSIWVVNAYQLAITVTLLPLAALGDRLGYRRVYMVGLAVFTLGSLGCALSHSLAALTTARVVQGLGAGGIM